MASITDQLKAYRPSATVLEAELAKGPRPGPSLGKPPPTAVRQVMQHKRTMHDSAIQVPDPLALPLGSLSVEWRKSLPCASMCPCLCCALASTEGQHALQLSASGQPTSAGISVSVIVDLCPCFLWRLPSLLRSMQA